jgi:hypothetical protein
MRGGFNLATLTWEDDLFALPRNPFTDDPVLLVPKRFLRTHPTLEKDSFKDYLWDRKNEELRNDLSFAIKADLDAEAIITIAREHREWVQEFVSYAEAEAAANAYDLDVDPDGLYKWHRITREFVANHPYSATVASDAAFGDFVASLAEKFKLFVELKGGWKLIWDQDKPLSEEGIQNYFYGVAYHYCAANSILMQREVETGRGPVDFYFSSGYHRRALMEAKLAKNGHFWNNLRRQLPEYMTAEGIARGHYLIVCYSDDDITKKADRIRETLQSAQVVTGYQIAASLIDARPSKPSASKLR